MKIIFSLHLGLELEGLCSDYEGYVQKLRLLKRNYSRVFTIYEKLFQGLSLEDDENYKDLINFNLENPHKFIAWKALAESGFSVNSDIIAEKST